MMEEVPGELIKMLMFDSSTGSADFEMRKELEINTT